MTLRALEIYKILIEKKVRYLYHANSVVTACSYLKEGALLSRREVEARKIPQTWQNSDSKDKKLHIWNHIFLDMYDFHKLRSDTNMYGPVLFVFDLEILRSGYVKDLNITQINPTHWRIGKSRRNYLFQDAKEFKRECSFENYPYSSMFMFNHKEGLLSLKKYLKEIILDCPKLKMAGTHLFDYALGSLQTAKRFGPLKNEQFQIKKRKCKPSCDCQRRFRTHIGRTNDHFGLVKPA